MTPASAKSNVVGPLRTVGLIDQESRPTELVNRWRDDEQYPQVCREIVERIYPEGLRDAFYGTDIERGSLERWFLRETGFGEGAARQMAAFYLLLNDANPSSETAKASAPKSPKGPAVRAPRSKSASTNVRALSEEPSIAGEPLREELPNSFSISGPTNGPSVHIDVQIHISPESSPEQIEVIFASMAEHIYGKSA